MNGSMPLPKTLEMVAGTLFLLFFLLFAVMPASAEVEIDLGDNGGQPTQAATPVPVAATPTPAPKKGTEVIVADDEEDDEEVYESNEETPVPAVTPTPVVKQIVGMLKMRDVYEAGVKSYKRAEYDQAIRYLKQALTLKDPYTKDYYYAEANAMLGIIYQFYFTVPGHQAKAYQYYQEALRIDSETETAKKHIREVRPR